MEIIVLLPKSPLPYKGRVGPKKLQNWYRQVKKTANLSKKKNIKIFIPSSFKTDDGKESIFLKKELFNLGIKKEMIEIEHKGNDTVSQLERVFIRKEDVYLVSTLLHFPRVWFECKLQKKKIKHIISFGIPRPKEAITDIFLVFIYPLIVLLGLKHYFRKITQERRIKGKL